MWRLVIVLAALLAMQAGSAAADLHGPYMVFFERGQDRLTPEAEATLRSAAQDYKARDDAARVEIAGNTDRVGSDASNLELSRRRAVRVGEFLASVGINPDVIIAEGYGETRPLRVTDDEVAEPANDRVEISFNPPPAR